MNEQEFLTDNDVKQLVYCDGKVYYQGRNLLPWYTWVNDHWERVRDLGLVLELSRTSGCISVSPPGNYDISLNKIMLK
jgi:hypothetical protein